jgi:hypothetical protein
MTTLPVELTIKEYMFIRSLVSNSTDSEKHLLTEEKEINDLQLKFRVGLQEAEKIGLQKLI